MEKNKQIIIGVIVVLVIVGGIFVLRGNKSNDGSSESGTPDAVKNDTNKFATLKEAYNSDKNLECTLSMVSGVGSQEYTYYFKDKNIRYDSSSTVGEIMVKTGQIIKNDVSYLWTDRAPSVITITDPKSIADYRSALFIMDAVITGPTPGLKFTCAQTTLADSLFDKPAN